MINCYTFDNGKKYDAKIDARVKRDLFGDIGSAFFVDYPKQAISASIDSVTERDGETFVNVKLINNLTVMLGGRLATLVDEIVPAKILGDLKDNYYVAQMQFLVSAKGTNYNNKKGNVFAFDYVTMPDAFKKDGEPNTDFDADNFVTSLFVIVLTQQHNDFTKASVYPALVSTAKFLAGASFDIAESGDNSVHGSLPLAYAGGDLNGLHYQLSGCVTVDPSIVVPLHDSRAVIPISASKMLKHSVQLNGDAAVIFGDSVSAGFLTTDPRAYLERTWKVGTIQDEDLQKVIANDLAKVDGAKVTKTLFVVTDDKFGHVTFENWTKVFVMSSGTM